MEGIVCIGVSVRERKRENGGERETEREEGGKR